MKWHLVAAFILASASLSLSFAQSERTWHGFVTDTHCGTHCQRTTTMKPDKDCVRRCVRQGSKYGLWIGNHVYELEPQSKAVPFAAENVRVTGTKNGDVIRVDSISQTGK